jgi:hypothetical protein
LQGNSPPDEESSADRRRGRRPTGTPEERIERRRRLGRERQVRRKERLPAGEICLALPVNHVLVGLMLESGAVDDSGSRNRKRLVNAILRILNNALSEAVAAGRKFQPEKEEPTNARTHSEGHRNGLR